MELSLGTLTGLLNFNLTSNNRMADKYDVLKRYILIDLDLDQLEQLTQMRKQRIIQ